MRWLACIATALFSSAGHAALTPDPTGLWLDPAESGWGLGVAQQGDTVFATLFVYDDAHRPTWYVAPTVKDDGRETFAAAPPVFVGTLYRTSGPPFGGAFDPHAVSSAQVGTLSITYTDGTGTRLAVEYTIDGVHVAKTLQPQSWGDASARLPGNYEGGLVITDKSPFGTCPPVSFGPFLAGRPFGFAISREASTVHLSWGTGIDTACAIDGTYEQRGQLGSITGSLSCGPIGSALAKYSVRLSELAIGAHGFAGLATVQNASCTYTGHIGGALQPQAQPREQSPDPTGFWMDPQESGWGMSVARQGDTAFVALYLYDDARRPTWYVASDARLRTDFTPFPGISSYHGTLYRTSGPVFGGTFDPHAVGIAEVGTIDFEYVANAPATLKLTYTIDGVRVAKTVAPQSWGEDRSLLVGHYLGARPSLTASSPGCDPASVDIAPPQDSAFPFSVTAGPAPEIHVLWNKGTQVCVLVGPYVQRGQLGSVAGVVGCVLPVDPTTNVPAELSELAIGPHGFSGLATFHKGSCAFTTSFGGVRQP